MKNILALLIVFSSYCTLYSQSESVKGLDVNRNKFYLGLTGDGTILSLNYERSYIKSPYLFLATKVGIGYTEEFNICLGECDPPDNYLAFPHHLTANFGTNQSFLEVGMGATFISGKTGDSYIAYPIVGYRYQGNDFKHFSFRAFVSLPLNGQFFNDAPIFVPFGISLGRSF